MQLRTIESTLRCVISEGEAAVRRTILAGASLMALAACGGNSEAVGENSPGSIKTTAMGNVVATIPSRTPTPTADEPMMSNEMENATTIDAVAVNAM